MLIYRYESDNKTPSDPNDNAVIKQYRNENPTSGMKNAETTYTHLLFVTTERINDTTERANGTNTKKFSTNAIHKIRESSNVNIWEPNMKLYGNVEFFRSFNLKKIRVHKNNINSDVMVIT